MGQLRHRPANKATEIGLAVVVAVFVQDARGRVLMRRRPGTDLWALPSGECARGESLGDAVMRHVTEQAGIDIRVMGLVGIYCDPRLGPGEPPLTACVRARPHDLAPTTASSDTRWIEPAALAAIPMPAPERRRVRHALEHHPVPFVDHRARKRTSVRGAALPRRGVLQRWLLKHHLHPLIDRP